jgi:non-ribosomal peptide synthetase component E (peptide arylation enzyme)
MSFDFATILRESSSALPEKPLCHGEHTFTYAQVDEISGRIATSLRDLGVGRGDKVAVQLPSGPHSLLPSSAFSKSLRRWTRSCAHRRSVITSSFAQRDY